MPLSQEQVDEIIRKYIRDGLENMDEQDAFSRFRRGRPLRKDELNEEIFGQYGLISTLELHESELKENLALGDYSSVTKSVDDIIDGLRLQIEKNSEDYFRLAHEILKVDIRLPVFCRMVYGIPYEFRIGWLGRQIFS